MAAAQQNGGAARTASPETAPADWNALKDDVGEAANAAVQRGLGFVDAAKAQAVDFADKRKGDAAQSVADLAQSLRESSRGFEDRPNIRAIFDSAADGLDQFAGTVRERSFDDIYADLEEIARARPAAFAAASAVAGFLLARFIKASADRPTAVARRNRSAAGVRHA